MTNSLPGIPDKIIVDVLSLSNDATAIYYGEAVIIQFANAAMLRFWGKENNVTGMPLEEAVPELKGQAFVGLLQQVWNTGINYEARDTMAELDVDGQLKEFYFDFVYKAIKDADGKMVCILHTATDVTERNQHLRALNKAKKLEESLGHEQFMNQQLAVNNNELSTLNEKLSQAQANLREANNQLEERMMLRTQALAQNEEELQAINEELQASNEELLSLNDELVAAQEKLSEKILEQMASGNSLRRAEEMLRFAIEASNVGTWFLNVETREFIPSARLRELFGYEPHEEMPYSAAITQITEEYQDIVHNAIEKAIAAGDRYDIEHPIKAFRDQQVRWVRAMGKLYPDSTGKLSHFSGIVMDITEQKRDDLRKNDFIAMVSHELKTPLTTIKAHVQLLLIKAEKTENTFMSGSLEKVQLQVNKMAKMINSFLNIARLESGKIHLDMRDIHLNTLITEIIEEVDVTTRSHPIRFVECEPMSVHADHDKIGQVINNLLMNAVKYSPKGKEIKVICVQDAGSIKVSIADQGVGINPADLPRLFERFYRVQNDSNKTTSGFGIGLYLSAEIIQRHGGQIWVESNPGAGSTFHFSLPRKKE